MLGRYDSELELGERRLLRRITHIGPQNAPPLDQRVGFQLDTLAIAALGRLGRDLDALAGDVVFPAMIGAAQPVFLVAAKPQRNATMRAELINQSITSLR